MADRDERPCAAVLGAGAGARACAADLALNGWRVRLWELSRFADNIAPLMDEPGLHSLAEQIKPILDRVRSAQP